MGRVKSIVRGGAILLLAASVTACWSTVRQPLVPDESQLQPAQFAITKAQTAGAGQLAPEALRESHRRVGVARGIIYAAAANGRGVSDRENREIDRLVEEAILDARLALVLTQQEAVHRKRKELREVANDGGES